jgi:hypothetical protein
MVKFGAKLPSNMSTCTQSAPAAWIFCTAAAKFAKSAAKIEGAIIVFKRPLLLLPLPAAVPLLLVPCS